ncbi:hypothetical protein PR003_g25074 [Phytophthora rubi]|uniref:Leucine-rich repeat-containing N-terminal plant-type domain-containing protein n=1 Tax=Phytophthora rubi TaxID=129364 RepID=A0A6A3IAW8_9STRA|nr:hypothetical protein PR002_g24212 [Phytophthora rubi]KAE9049531.1 hypothetical protein PR001_g3206 [Phytophthora rubi]KAE9291288.1 hypothetical protein PR003_g25074 [Phytophthora rubi]
MSRFQLMPKASTEVVRLPFWAFTLWWIFILAVHVVTCVYNALYAYCYMKLSTLFINLYLTSFQIGMPAPYHHRIAIVHAIMSALHAVCIVLMLVGTIKQRSLAFTPWRSCNADAKTEEKKTSRTSSVIVESFTKVYTKVSDRHGIFGVNGNHFHAVHICREILETALQTAQAYRMSTLLPRTLLNQFYVILLAINCWSSVIVYSIFFKKDEARRRFASIVLDCALDLMACMGVELIVLLSYVKLYDPNVQSFPNTIWYDDEWVARALNELKVVVVVSWSDLGSRTVFSLGLILTTMNMKELLQFSPRNGNRVAEFVHASDNALDSRTASDKFWNDRINAVSPRNSTQPLPTKISEQSQPSSPESSKRELLKKRNDSYRDTNLRTRGARLMLRLAHIMFGLWGLVVLSLHIHAAVQPTLSQCLLQVRPWAVAKPSCYLVGLNCHTLGITGKMDEVEEKWSEFDSFTVAQLLIRHCPELEMPDIVTTFHRLRNIKIYNTTILEWGESAAITNTNHPEMASLLVVRVNMTDGLLPAGFQSTDFPPTLYDFEFCVTNLRMIPDDLDTKWPMYSIIQLEYSQLTVVPPALARLEPIYLVLDGNPLLEVPPEIFEVQGMTFLSLSNTKLVELPRNVTNLSADLSWIFVGHTQISFFWEWADPLVMRMQTQSRPWIAGPSPYCDDLAKIENGTATAFRVPLLPEYSQTLMDPSEANRPVLRLGVLCDPTITGLFYPLDIEDSMSAISTPPPLPTQV